MNENARAHSALVRVHAIKIATFTFATMLAVVGCGRAPSTTLTALSDPSSIVNKVPGAVDVNYYPADKIICDPGNADASSGPQPDAGLNADLYYLNSSESSAVSSSDLLSRGHHADARIFFGSIDSPTAPFSKGFVNGLGHPLIDNQKKPVTGNFALDIRSQIKLALDQSPGTYEFALIASDGTLLNIADDSGSLVSVINVDGSHAARLNCSSATFDFTTTTMRALRLIDFQSGRHPLSLVMLMRPLAPGQSAGQDPACSPSGTTDGDDSQWFNADQDSSPQAAYQALLSRGWRPVSTTNFVLPSDVLFNPCINGGMIPKIMNFMVTQTSSHGFTLKWDTDIPATAQISVTDVNTQAEALSVSDNVLRQHHSVTVEGLNPNTAYSLEALSISDTYGKGVSSALFASTKP